MGFWGVALYQNDIAMDVKDFVEEQLRKGMDIDERELLNNFVGLENDLREETAFWFALADTQWNYGVLSQYVKTRVLKLIHEGADLEEWKHLHPVILLQRKRVVYDLEQKLLQEQPAKNIPKKRRVYRCQWKVGDVFAYRLQCDLAKERGLAGKYLLIRKVDEGIWHPGHVVPIVNIKLTQDSQLPNSVEEYDALEYIQTALFFYEERFLPIDGRRPKEDIEEKSKIVYETDEYGHLPVFRIKLLNTSQKVIPSDLIYLGNFAEAQPPKKEFIPHSKLNLKPVYWQKANRTFEESMVKNYCNYNLRELSLYKEGQKGIDD